MNRALDLVTDCVTGQLSHTKIWTNIAYLAATVAFLRLTLASSEPLRPEIWFIYLGIVGGHNILSKFVSMKYGAPK